MQLSQASYKKSSKSHTKLNHLLREGVLIIVVGVSLFLLLALVTYHATDPGWSKTGLSIGVKNAGGYVGAWLSDALLCAFGFIAYLLPFLLIYASYLFFMRKPTDEANDLLFMLRAFGFLLILMNGSSLFALHFHGNHLPFGAGGVLGNFYSLLMVKIFSHFGANLLLTFLLLAGITLFTGLSWVKVATFSGKSFIRFVDFIGNHVIQVVHFGSAKTKVVKLEPKVEVSVEPSPIIETNKDTLTAPMISQPPPIRTSLRAEREKQAVLFEPVLEGSLPPLSLLDVPEKSQTNSFSKQQLEEMSRNVESRLLDFGIESQVVAVHPGPVVTRYELQLAAGTKVNRITSLAKDLARSLSVASVRVVEVIPGKSVIGLELPNENRQVVRLREILSSQQYEQTRSPLTLALGKDIAGHPVIVDLAKMPHLLVAGTTGSGKSVCLNALLLSLLYKYTPDQVRLIMIDPKMLELSVYEGIPHLLTPVVTDMKEAANALRWCVAEMERRYKVMVTLGVRNISGYNHKVREAKAKGSPLLDPLWEEGMGEGPQELQELPYVVVLADEFADMIMVVGKKVEELIARIAQKARAAGIHLILATQRPSVDVITGLIKANIPTRIAFQVSSKIDSRTILDQSGAEQLLGFGDMLYLPQGSGIPVRIHGAFVADDEVPRVVKDLKRRGQPPQYIEQILDGSVGPIVGIDGEQNLNGVESDAEQDPLYDQAVNIVIESRRASVSNIQRRLKIGYNRAARLVETMEAAGIVSPMETNGNREVLAPPLAED